ncbi:MAG: hypothetical protein DRG71_08355 [Deltaproteobacteria bacterium]|nr:MAG: hypothetical protein DRG71_08355 [Deltaproteobacteria bacterium]
MIICYTLRSSLHENGRHLWALPFQPLETLSKVVIATGYAMDKERKEMVSQLSKALISKPFRVKELTILIRKILDSN